jgi:hypothetical protein
LHNGHHLGRNRFVGLDSALDLGRPWVTRQRAGTILGVLFFDLTPLGLVFLALGVEARQGVLPVDPLVALATWPVPGVPHRPVLDGIVAGALAVFGREVAESSRLAGAEFLAGLLANLWGLHLAAGRGQEGVFLGFLDARHCGHGLLVGCCGRRGAG